MLAAALRHLDRVLELPRLNGVQWVYGAGNEPAARWGGVYRKIQAAGKCMQVICTDMNDARAVAEQVRPELAARRITHVYVHWGEIARYRRTKYGFTDFIQPHVFAALVTGGVLRPLPAIEGHPGRAYRVVRKDEG